jgi:hypothetical protein
LNIELFSIKTGDINCSLALVARDMPGQCMDVRVLDRPFLLTQETRETLPPLSDATRERLEQKDFPASILDVIGSEAEAAIYEEAGLQPAEVNGQAALVRTDIDYDLRDEFDNGKTNLDRMREGRPPLDATGRPVELHHIGQEQHSPLAELTRAEHCGKGNDNVLHNKLKESAIDRADFAKERAEHWKARAQQIDNQRAHLHQ